MLRHPVFRMEFFSAWKSYIYFGALRIAIRFVSSCGGDSLKILNRSREKNRPSTRFTREEVEFPLFRETKRDISLSLSSFFYFYYNCFKDINIYFGHTVVLFTHFSREITTLRFARRFQHESTLVSRGYSVQEISRACKYGYWCYSYSY